ncbi:hypothetical protein E4T66_17455 [Sinimarinibacterium sp. CAU 1509]|uniref:hypothetical protein n=1 Tax=Sinimarinibacterium sp. CAU 1509 TaxID=2562283 RepID=UPI0010AC990E|nr:hypothetical protein [Sinimarinibacterium sp. CAU 1509]TJY57196.1 hypothetical protein E4T66_17455 [Sinimarinibacterium sp. CAU 1509]
MQRETARQRAERVLDELSLTARNGHIEIIDFKEAESCYVHHSRRAVALTGYACVSPVMARGRFPRYTFIDMIQGMPAMDGGEAWALAAICGATIPESYSDWPQAFGERVWRVVQKYDLDAFFERVTRPFGSGGDHYHLRPRGFDWESPDRTELPDVLARWRSEYRKSPPVRQVMTATVLQLYRQGEDKHWMVRVPKGWHASEGIEILQAADALEDWGGLCATYAGW